MDLKYVKKLIKLLANSPIDEIEIEEEGKRIRIAKNTNSKAQAPLQSGQATIPESAGASIVVPQNTPAAPSPSSSHTLPPSAEVTTQKKYHVITSPIVGTFYRVPAPDADPYVEVGQVVQPGTVLCIIEAMKLMNEIESDVAGRIAKIHVENGQPVEYNQQLFSIEPI